MEEQSFNDSAVPDSPAADFYDVYNGTFCREGYNLTGNGTVCARASMEGSVLSDGTVLLYIVGLLTFYGCSMLFLLLLFAKSEQEDIELESYYETYIERAELRDGMARGVIRGETAGRPAQTPGAARGVIRGETAGRPAQTPGAARGVIRGVGAGRPAQTAGRPAQVSGMARGLIRGRSGDVPGAARGLVRGETLGRPAQTARRPAEVSGMPPAQPYDFGKSGMKDMVQ